MIFYNKLFPIKGFKAMNLFGLLLIRKDQRAFMSAKDYNHEQIHTAQYRELGYLFFLPIYIIEWLIKLCYYRFHAHRAYRAVSFEREAYLHEREKEYLAQRKHYSWIKYIKS